MYSRNICLYILLAYKTEKKKKKTKPKQGKVLETYLQLI